MTVTRTLRIGTRRSALARAQTQHIVEALGVPIEIVPIVTQGDRSTEALAQLGGTGVFVSALRSALLTGEIDAAVHSFKDLPTAAADGIVVGAVPPREDARDALVARSGLTLAELPQGARIGTGSPRRAAQLRALGLGLEIIEIRGNVDTRLGKVASGELDGVVLALAGLRRLGRDSEATEVLDPIQVLPAAAQGALAVECRASSEEVRATLAGLEHADTRIAVTAERALLAALEAGCSAPVGAIAEVVEGDYGTDCKSRRPASGDERSRRDGCGTEVFLRASVTAIDGSAAVRLSATGPTTDAEGVGRRLAAELLADGADRMMGSSS
ncbi:MAG: hydroxymethylbilane synthase [Jatrophihabitantaceae bacterium]